MDMNEHTKPENLLKYAFYYNEVRLVLAAITLLLGKMSPVLMYFYIPLVSSLAGALMTLAWILAGVAAGYLLYLWWQGGKTLWGTDDIKDRVAFAIAIISGLHLGWAGLFGVNIGMSVLPMLNIVMPVAGLLYLWSAWHLFHRYKANSIIFGIAKPKEASAETQSEPSLPTTTE